MQIYSMPFYNEQIQLALPDRWDMHFLPIKDARPLSQDAMRQAFLNPIDSPRISELAKGRKTAAVVVEDISRPTPTHQFLPLLIEELKRGGMSEDNIKFISAIGCHRPQMTGDFRHKLGDWIADNFTLINPSLYEGQKFIGKTTRGTKVELYSEFVDADLKIGVGGIIPHSDAGFGGGAKVLLPVIASWETIGHIHGSIKPGGYGVMEGNQFRANIDEVAELAGLDAIVNGVVCRDRSQLAGLFVGHPCKAHRCGVDLARDLFTVEAPKNADIAIIDAYPMDIDLVQSGRSLGANMPASSVRDGGAILVLAAAPDGAGYHALMYRRHTHQGRSMPKPSPVGKEVRWLLYSPNVRPRDWRGVEPFASLKEALGRLEAYYPAQSVVNIFPQGALTLVASEAKRDGPDRNN